jgi:hypothetical protein
VKKWIHFFTGPFALSAARRPSAEAMLRIARIIYKKVKAATVAVLYFRFDNPIQMV